MNNNHLIFKALVTVISISFITYTSSVQGQTIKLMYYGKNDSLASIITKANEILKNPEFYKNIASVESFDNSKYSGKEIATEFRKLNQNIVVKTYWNPFGIANAKTASSIKLNSTKLRRSQKSILNTIIHETVHAVDWLTNRRWDYTHDGNRPDNQDKTAPWVIGEISEKIKL